MSTTVYYYYLYIIYFNYIYYIFVIYIFTIIYMNKIFIDNNSELNEYQIKTINSILNSEYNRFDRASKQKKITEQPLSSQIGKSYSHIYNYSGRKYLNHVSMSFELDIDGMENGVGYQVIGNLPVQGEFIKAAGFSNEDHYLLPGYFTWNTRDSNNVSIVFVYDDDMYPADSKPQGVFQVYLYYKE